MGSCLGRNTDTNTTINSNNNNKNNNHSLATSCLRRQTSDDQEQDLISNFNSYLNQDSFLQRITNFKRKKKSRHILKTFWLRKNPRYTNLNKEAKEDTYMDIQLQNLDVGNLLLNSNPAQDETSVNYLANGRAVSRGNSSLDLEWEHEYTQLTQFEPFQNNQNIPSCELINYPNSGSINENEHEASLTSVTSLTSLTGSHYDFPYISNKEKPSQSGSKQRLNRGRLTRNSSHQSWSHLSTPESLEWDIDEEQQEQLTMEDDNLDDETLKLLHQIEQLKNRVLCETGDTLYNDFKIDCDHTKDILEGINDNDYPTTHLSINNNDNCRRPYFQWLDSDSENGNCS